MKLLSALVLAIPFVVAAPVPDVEGEVAVAPVSATSDTTLPVVAAEDGSKPIDAVGKKGIFRAGDKVYPSKEALTEALKKNGAQPQDGYGPGYDYYGYPQAYPVVGYDYNSYPYYPQDLYAADFYKAQKEQADYEQALKEYEYKKYLYDTDQTHLRPDLFPEHQAVVPKQQEIEQQIVSVEKPETATRQPDHVRPASKPAGQFKPPKPEQAHKFQFDEEEEEAPIQIDHQANFHRPEHSHASNFNSAPAVAEDRKFQAQPQKNEHAERPKKQTPRPHFEEFPENRNFQYIKQNDDSEAPFFPAESAYYPKAAEKPRYRPSASIATNAAKEPEAPALRDSGSRERERERERIPVAAPVAPTQVQNQSQRPSLNQYQRPKAEAPNNHNFNPAALPPAPVPYQHNQQFRPSNALREERIGQAQVYPRENTLVGNPPSAGADVYPTADPEKAASGAGNSGIANANFVIFNRDTLGKRILGKHGYLEETSSDWVVPTAAY